MPEAAVNNVLQKVKLEFVVCHRKPERSFFYKGRQFPVCARCTGFYLAYITLPVFTFSWWAPGIFITLALMLPALADGLTQAYFTRESNNTIRVITGFIAGAGIMSLTAITGKGIGYLILSAFK